MKNIFFICMFGLLAFAGCSDNEEEILTGGNIDIDMLPPNQPNDVIDEKLFAVINLDYPGLEKAKEFYNSGKYYYAVNELLEYYRNRKLSGRQKHNAKWMAIYNDFIVCYETGMTMLEIAKRNGVSERTIYRYKEEYEKMKGSGE